jgi:hypothetical protein
MVMLLDFQHLKLLPLVMAQDKVEAAALKNQIPNVKVPPNSNLLLILQSFIFVDVGSCNGFGGLEAATACQVAREDLTIAKAKAPSSKHA